MKRFARYSRLRTNLLAPLKAGLAALCFAAALSPVRAQYSILHEFTGSGGGDWQCGSSLTPSGATLYGMTYSGGASDAGVVFKVNTDGSSYTSLHDFAWSSGNGACPLFNSLTLSGTTFYGVTCNGGASSRGVVFKMNVDGSGYTNLHEFAGGSEDGAWPYDSLLLSGATLYGTTCSGGAFGHGVVFKMNVDGSGYTNLHEFAGGSGDGAGPASSPMLSGTTLYGMTCGGGAFGHGVVFKMNVDGSGYTNLHEFAGGSGDGANPWGSLTLSGGTLYGMTDCGGASDCGAVFKMNVDGSGYINLHEFAWGWGDGAWPCGSLTLIGATLYGTASDGGASNRGMVFKINVDGSGYTDLHDFAGGNGDGAWPDGSLTLIGATLYGMTPCGGTSDAGVVFALQLADLNLVTITTSSALPAGAVGVPYGQTLTATNGIMPYTWSVVSNSLPSGLWLDAGSGTITGAPTVAATVNFRVRVTGADSLYAEKDFTLTIQPGTPMTITGLRAKLNFAKPNADSASLSAVLNLNAGFSVTNKTVTVDIGGTTNVTFTLDAKGRGVSDFGSCNLAYKKKTGLWTLSANLAKGAWHTEWASHGLVNTTVRKPGAWVMMPVIVVIGDESFAGERPMLYTATKDKTGLAK